MLHAQMNTTMVKSGGKITARPRITARRMGSKIEAGLLAVLDMFAKKKPGLELELGRQKQGPARALLSSPSPRIVPFASFAHEQGARTVYSGITGHNGRSAPIEQLGDMQQLRLFPCTVHPPANVHQTAGIGRNDAVGPAGQNALHLVFDHIARNLRIANGERAPKAAALVLPGE